MLRRRVGLPWQRPVFYRPDGDLRDAHLRVWGQVKPTNYPDDWQTVRTMIDDDPEDFTVLVLPWHMYMGFDWLPNRWNNLANPAPSFFSKPVISGDNIEVPPNYSDSSDPRSKYEANMLRNYWDGGNPFQTWGSLFLIWTPNTSCYSRRPTTKRTGSYSASMTCSPYSREMESPSSVT